MAASKTDRPGSGSDQRVATLPQALAGEHSLARSVAGILSNPDFDWDALARAVEEVRGREPSTDPGRSALDRAAILAMRLRGDAAQGAAEILAACVSESEPEQMLRRMLAVLPNHIPFDTFSYSEYSYGAPSDPIFVQSRFALDGSEEFRWPARWIEVPPTIVAWVEGTDGKNKSGDRFISDVENFYAERPEADRVKSNLVAQEYARRGITSFLVAPRLDGGRVTAVLTLGRRAGQHRPFDRYDQDQLDNLRVELALREIGKAYERRSSNLVQEIIGLFTPAADPAELAQTAVRKLGEGYGLEYVGLFRVNRARGRFELVAEHDRHGELQVSLEYTQDLQKGMLGHVLREGHELYARNVRQKPAPYDYITTRTAQASALCLPIHRGRDRNSEIEWILDLESSQFDAFPRPEQESLKKIVAEVERSLQLWFEARLCKALLNLVEQGVVVLGEQTRIERANAEARRLLGLPEGSKLPLNDEFADLEAFAADEATRELIREGSPSSAGALLRLKGPDGTAHRVLAGSSYRDEAFNRRIWLLRDVEQPEWVGALHYMEAAVRTVAAQAHGGLRLAGALLRSARSTLDPGMPVYALVDRAMRSITMADLTYERIACVYDAIRTPWRREGVLNVGAMLLQYQSSLPADDAQGLKLDIPEAPIVVDADPERLSFAMRSLLGYLLALSHPGMQLRASVSASQHKALVAIELTGVPSNLIARLDRLSVGEKDLTTDKIAYAESCAVAVAAHGLEAVRAVVTAHGGQLDQYFGDNGTVYFKISGLRLTGASLGRSRKRFATSVRSDRRTS
ncbi:GAF domain-containing protein [Bradyrhizobium sp. ARR65]|uniref:GAF domain-containing protein n=1 Tax=Bradyrhizobium sp. ARR65 TaxID=1040989 RepID=UPI000467B86D|nr:GAF domain-containing protein [Bradyrhizobium sp. ARR65]